jgi:hypothetical protein
MKIKSFLLGSAAVILAANGARSADAVAIAEPEAMEQVRVCDTYGTGFFYIPGTETCLGIGGYLRYDIGIGSLGNEDVFDVKDFVDGVDDTNDTYYKRARFALRVDTRSETELGTLRTYAQLNFQYDSDIDDDGFSYSYDNFEIEHAYIELDGFRIGKTDSMFSTFVNYAGGVINDDLVGYGPFGTHQIAYTFTSENGFSAAIALEEGNDTQDYDFDGDEVVDFTASYGLDSYIPHVVAGASYTRDWGGISAVVGYDANFEEYAGKLRLDITASEQLSLFVMAGYASNDDDFGDDSPNYYGSWAGDWAVWGGGTYQATEKAAINVQLSYDEQENFAAVANVAYELVSGFTITPEVAYTDNFDIEESDDVGGFLRFERTF